MNKSKIGIMTFWKAVNPGAFLQQYALQHILKQLTRKEVLVIRYRSDFARREIVSRLRSGGGLDRLYRVLEGIQFWRYSRRFFDYGPHVTTGRESDLNSFEQIVFGSDEIWNIDNWFSGYCPLLFGENIKGIRKIAFSPSFGEMRNASAVPESARLSLASFEHISVRDHNSRDLVLELTGRDPPVTLDPTLLYDFSEEINREKAIPGSIIVYATHLSSLDALKLKRYAEHTGRKVISIGFRHRNDVFRYQKLTPFGILSAFRDAAAVFTNTFHGTVFSLKFNKPFLLGDIHGKSNKLRSLIGQLQVKAKQISEIDDDCIVDAFSAPPFDRNSNILNRQIDASLGYLRESL